uniref:Serine/threonine protein phosphatase 7 long form isogeny n=1 Tax=Cajanus cajan TaxID=3821 RepID=A0A151TDT6_CAJCA|nr:Serine/threonine protein phosphatase 7 long form isogeny [Cajanus cajan]
MRQFGMVQHIPRPPRQPDNLHDLTLRGKDDIDWRVQHAVFLHEWETRLDRVWTQEACTTTRLSSNSEYMVWYKRHTRRWIGLITAKHGYVVSNI